MEKVISYIAVGKDLLSYIKQGDFESAIEELVQEQGSLVKWESGQDFEKLLLDTGHWQSGEMLFLSGNLYQLLTQGVVEEKVNTSTSKKKYVIAVGEWLATYILIKDFDKAVQEIRYNNGEIFEWTEGDDLEELLANLLGWNNFIVIDEDSQKEINTRLQSILDNGEQILN